MWYFILDSFKQLLCLNSEAQFRRRGLITIWWSLGTKISYGPPLKIAWIYITYSWYIQFRLIVSTRSSWHKCKCVKNMSVRMETPTKRWEDSNTTELLCFLLLPMTFFFPPLTLFHSFCLTEAGRCCCGGSFGMCHHHEAGLSADWTWLQFSAGRSQHNTHHGGKEALLGQ